MPPESRSAIIVLMIYLAFTSFAPATSARSNFFVPPRLPFTTLERAVISEPHKFFRTELIGRFDEKLVFKPLSSDTQREIALLAITEELAFCHRIAVNDRKECRPSINVTSEAGSISTMNHFRSYYYFGSKAAMSMFSRSMAWDPDTAGIITIALQPGWMRTDMGGSDADLSVTESAEGILKVIANLTPGDNGKFYRWDGKEYPW